jgi:hypothetical protein
MSEENFFRRLPLLGFWIIPVVGSDLVEALSGHQNLTPAGSWMISMAVTILLMALWILCGWITFRDARSHFIRGAYSSGWVAKFEGKLFLMLPVDGELRDAIRTGNKSVEDFINAERRQA